MPSKRFWAKNNPELDYAETVTKTKNILSDFKFEKIIHVSTVSARCQLNTVYGWKFCILHRVLPHVDYKPYLFCCSIKQPWST